MQYTEFTQLSRAIIEGMSLPTGPAFRMFLYHFPDMQTRASKLEVLETIMGDMPEFSGQYADDLERFKAEPGLLCMSSIKNPHVLLYTSGLEAEGAVLRQLGRPVYQVEFPEMVGPG